MEGGYGKSEIEIIMNGKMSERKEIKKKEKESEYKTSPLSLSLSHSLSLSLSLTHTHTHTHCRQVNCTSTKPSVLYYSPE